MIGPDPAEPRVLQGEGVHTSHALWDGGTSERGGHGATPGLAPGEAGGEDAPSLSLLRQVWSAGDLGWRTRSRPGLATEQLLPGRDVPGASAAAGGPEPGRGWAGGTYLPRDIPAPGVSGSQGAPSKGIPFPPVFQEGVRPEGRFRGTRSPFVSEAGLQTKRSGGSGVRPRQARPGTDTGTCSPLMVEQGQAREEVLGPPAVAAAPEEEREGQARPQGLHPGSPVGPVSLSPSRDGGATPGGSQQRNRLLSNSQASSSGPTQGDRWPGVCHPAVTERCGGRVQEACDEGDTSMTGSKSLDLGSPRFPGPRLWPES